MIDPAFLGLARIGLLCRVEPDDAAARTLAEQICDRAAALVSERLAGGLQAVALRDFDPRITDPGTLLVTIHGNRVGGRLLLAIGLRREGNPPGSLFPAPPQLVESASGPALDRALLALVEHPVLAPLSPPPPGPSPLR